MNMTVTKNEGSVPFSVLHLEGKLDGSNYESLVREAENLYAAGVRDLLLDLSRLTFISSAGMAGLHKVALLFRGEEHLDQDQGWGSYHAIDRDRSRGTQEHVKLVSPYGSVHDVLELTGFNSIFEIFADLPQAAASFRQSVPAEITRPQ